MRLRIFLTLERGRNIALRNLLRKVYLAAGFEDLKEGQTEQNRVRKSRIPLSHFVAGFKIGTGGEGSGEDLEVEEVECLIINQIRLVRTSIPPYIHSQANACAGTYEGLHFTRALHGSPEQEGRLPWNRRLMPKRLTTACSPYVPPTPILTHGDTSLVENMCDHTALPSASSHVVEEQGLIQRFQT